MKKLILLTTLFAVSTLAKADTIDFWRVYYNGKQISEIGIARPHRSMGQAGVYTERTAQQIFELPFDFIERNKNGISPHLYGL